MHLRVKVVPGAARDGVVGWLGDELKLRVAAPAERGRANAAVERLLATALRLPAASVRITAGHGSPRKLVEIDDLDERELRARLTDAAG